MRCRPARVKTFSIGFGERELRRVGTRPPRGRTLRHRPPRGGLHAAGAWSTSSRPWPTSSTSPSPTPRSSRRTSCHGSRASRSRSRSAGTEATSCSPATRRSRPTASPASTGCRGLSTSASSCRSPTGCPSRRQLQLRLQAQALPAGSDVAGRRAPRAVARLVLARTSRRALLDRSPADPFDGAPAALRRALRPDDPARAADLPLREDVPPGRHPRQGRPGEHGVLARGARAVPRHRARRVPGTGPVAPQAAPLRHEAPAQARDGRHASTPGSRAREEGLRDPGRRVAQGRAAGAAPGRALSGAHRGHRASSSRAEVQRLLSRAPRRAVATTASSSGRCSSSSSGIAVGSRPGVDSPSARPSPPSLSSAAAERPMKRSLLDQLICPLSSDPLGRALPAADDVETGELVCTRLRPRWAIRGGIPRLVPPDLEAQQRQTADAFGWQWQHFPSCIRSSRRSSSTGSIRSNPSSSRASACSTQGAAPAAMRTSPRRMAQREVVALDLSAAVETARCTSRVRQRARRAGRPAATAFSHGRRGRRLRLHLLDRCPPPSPRSVRRIPALLRLPPTGRDDRRLGLRLREQRFRSPRRRAAAPRNDEAPARRSCARSHGRSRSAFTGSRRASTGRLSDTRVGRSLPLNEYMSSVADFSFRQNYGIVFDQLSAPTAAYIKGPELERWFVESGLSDVHVSIATATRGAAAVAYPAEHGGLRQPGNARGLRGLSLMPRRAALRATTILRRRVEL